MKEQHHLLDLSTASAIAFGFIFVILALGASFVIKISKQDIRTEEEKDEDYEYIQNQLKEHIEMKQDLENAIKILKNGTNKNS